MNNHKTPDLTPAETVWGSRIAAINDVDAVHPEWMGRVESVPRETLNDPGFNPLFGLVELNGMWLIGTSV